MIEETKIYSVKFFFLEGNSEGVAIIAANEASEAEFLLNTTGNLKDYKMHIIEMVELPGSKYNGSPVLIKEYLFPDGESINQW